LCPERLPPAPIPHDDQPRSSVAALVEARGVGAGRRDGACARIHEGGVGGAARQRLEAERATFGTRVDLTEADRLTLAWG